MTLLAFMRRADEGTLSRLMVEATILLAASSPDARRRAFDPVFNSLTAHFRRAGHSANGSQYGWGFGFRVSILTSLSQSAIRSSSGPSQS
jgi:hypothetical protein